LGAWWGRSRQIHEDLHRLIAKNRPDLAAVLDEIVIVFKEKAGHSGGRTVYGGASRSSPMTNTLAGKDYKFSLTIGSDAWEHELTSKQREALLDFLLTACRVEEDKKSGELKCRVVKPDILGYRENFERYGFWMPRENEDEEVPPTDPIADMMGVRTTN